MAPSRRPGRHAGCFPADNKTDLITFEEGIIFPNCKIKKRAYQFSALPTLVVGEEAEALVTVAFQQHHAGRWQAISAETNRASGQTPEDTLK